MPKRVYVLLATVCALTVGCATPEQPTNTRRDFTQPVGEYYVQTLMFDRSVPYPRTGRYAWYPPNEQQNKRIVKDHRMILNAVSAGFRKQGFSLSPKIENIDFYMAYYFVEDDQTTDRILNKNYSFTEKDRWVPGETEPKTYTRSTLVLDLVCARDLCPRWRASIGIKLPDSIGDKEKQALFKQHAERLTRNMPPKGARLLDEV